MNYKHLFICALISLFAVSITSAQAQQTEKAAAFHGAVATKDEYNAVFELNSSEDKVIRGTLRNISNVLKDNRLHGKIKIELVAHSGGIAAFMKKNHYEDILKDLSEKGVILAACENTMRERNISKSEIFPFVSYVPSGVGELIIRGQQGWTVIHP